MFSILYGVFAFWDILTENNNSLDEATQILHVVSVFVLLFLRSSDFKYLVSSSVFYFSVVLINIYLLLNLFY